MASHSFQDLHDLVEEMAKQMQEISYTVRVAKNITKTIQHMASFLVIEFVLATLSCVTRLTAAKEDGVCIHLTAKSTRLLLLRLPNQEASPLNTS